VAFKYYVEPKDKKVSASETNISMQSMFLKCCLFRLRTSQIVGYLCGVYVLRGAQGQAEVRTAADTVPTSECGWCLADNQRTPTLLRCAAFRNMFALQRSDLHAGLAEAAAVHQA
jgi:hypothetical protein